MFIFWFIARRETLSRLSEESQKAFEWDFGLDDELVDVDSLSQSNIIEKITFMIYFERIVHLTVCLFFSFYIFMLQ